MQARRQSSGEEGREARVLLGARYSTWGVVGIGLPSGHGGFQEVGVVNDLAMFMCYHIAEKFDKR